jgi:hypothetical protein
MLNNTEFLEYSIAKITCPGIDKDRYGTGYLVSSDIIMTSKHVIKYSLENPENIRIDFNVKQINRIAQKVIDINKEIDVALIRLDRPIIDLQPFELVSIPYNMNDLYNGDIIYNLIGYLSDGYNPSTFRCYTNSLSHDTMWDLNISFAQNYSQALDLGGISGSPFFLKDKVLGMAIRQVDNSIGVPSGIVSVLRMKDFLDKNGIKYREFHSFEMITKEEIKNRLLNEAMNEIKTKYFLNDKVKDIIYACSEVIINKIKNLDIYEFTSLIDTIKTTFNISYELDEQYKLYVKSFAEIVAHISLIYFACKGKLTLDYNLGANLKINESNYLGYLFSENHDAYIITVIRLLEHIINNPINKLNNCTKLIIGNDNNENCKDKCSNCFTGSKYDFDSIIGNISYPSFLLENRQEITDIKERFNDIEFHCKKCLEYSTTINSNTVGTEIINIIGRE